MAIASRLNKDFLNAPDKDRSCMERWMAHWCEGRRLTPERFKVNIRRDKASGIRIDEFKAYQLRAYGFSQSAGETKIFLVCAVDIKKQDKADPAVIDRCIAVATTFRWD